MWPSHPTPEYTPGENTVWNDTYTSMFIAALFMMPRYGNEDVKAVYCHPAYLTICRVHHPRKRWQPTAVLLPGKSHGWRSLVGCSPWGHRVGHDWSNLAAAAAVAENIIRNAGLDEAQAGIKIAREISITSDMQMTPPLWQKVKRN